MKERVYCAPSFQPIGINAAATSSTPRSVASLLYCDAAFLVSSTSTLIPRLLITRLVAGLHGRLSGPSPKSSRSVVPPPLAPEHTLPCYSRKGKRKKERKNTHLASAKPPPAPQTPPPQP